MSPLHPRPRWPELPDVPMSHLVDEARQAVNVIAPMYALLHLVAPSTSPSLGLPAVLLADLCGRAMAPVLGVGLLVAAVLAVLDHEIRDLPAVYTLALLCALMLQTIFSALV